MLEITRETSGLSCVIGRCTVSIRIRISKGRWQTQGVCLSVFGIFTVPRRPENGWEFALIHLGVLTLYG